MARSIRIPTFRSRAMLSSLPSRRTFSAAPPPIRKPRPVYERAVRGHPLCRSDVAEIVPRRLGAAVLDHAHRLRGFCDALFRRRRQFFALGGAPDDPFCRRRFHPSRGRVRGFARLDGAGLSGLSRLAAPARGCRGGRPRRTWRAALARAWAAAAPAVRADEDRAGTRIVTLPARAYARRSVESNEIVDSDCHDGHAGP